MSQAFVGEIKLLGFGWAPRGFMLCAGQTLAINTQTALFSLLGVTYGGDGVSTFKLPDLRSRHAVGYGQGLGLSPYVLGQAAGNEQTTLLISNLPTHNHSAVLTPPTIGGLTAQTTINAVTQPGSRQTSPANALLTGATDSNGAPVNGYTTVAANATLAAGAATTTLSGALSGGGVTVGTTGSSAPFGNLPPYLAINYVIAIEGIYPSRN